jgi:hypothetical protein
MRGDIVIVRAHGGQPLVRRVWEVNGNVVYITNDEQLKRNESGLPMLWPVGFPSEDVFCFSPQIANRSKVEWESLKPYEG